MLLLSLLFCSDTGVEWPLHKNTIDINYQLFRLVCSNEITSFLFVLLDIKKRVQFVPVEVEFVSQDPPVVASDLRSVQAATQLLSDGQRDAEGVRTH